MIQCFFTAEPLESDAGQYIYCGLSYKGSTIVNCVSRVTPDQKIACITIRYECKLFIRMATSQFTQ